LKVIGTALQREPGNTDLKNGLLMIVYADPLPQPSTITPPSPYKRRSQHITLHPLYPALEISEAGPQSSHKMKSFASNSELMDQCYQSF